MCGTCQANGHPPHACGSPCLGPFCFHPPFLQGFRPAYAQGVYKGSQQNFHPYGEYYGRQSTTPAAQPYYFSGNSVGMAGTGYAGGWNSEQPHVNQTSDPQIGNNSAQSVQQLLRYHGDNQQNQYNNVQVHQHGYQAMVGGGSHAGQTNPPLAAYDACIMMLWLAVCLQNDSNSAFQLKAGYASFQFVPQPTQQVDYQLQQPASSVHTQEPNSRVIYGQQLNPQQAFASPSRGVPTAQPVPRVPSLQTKKQPMAVPQAAPKAQPVKHGPEYYQYHDRNAPKPLALGPKLQYHDQDFPKQPPLTTKCFQDPRQGDQASRFASAPQAQDPKSVKDQGHLVNPNADGEIDIVASSSTVHGMNHPAQSGQTRSVAITKGSGLAQKISGLPVVIRKQPEATSDALSQAQHRSQQPRREQMNHHIKVALRQGEAANRQTEAARCLTSPKPVLYSSFRGHFQNRQMRSLHQNLTQNQLARPPSNTQPRKPS
ncbi:hypothetical protein P154DRAFT_110698 [Amniculicola lignicola CBS 123094]|uniref:Uncharacterized protein n=1 Tax=Amniculicola lignicola CBS 123094 TaxID=1392246 RepID=A0A6A5WN07_9PLEO|nr:hypothetical protein P154DRAFT_110698 [Amniculicola lignicola CBS 123094]